MKTIKTLLMLLVSALACRAQTDKTAVVVTTNLVTAAANFREVNGRLYNTEFSTSWFNLDGTICDLSGNGDVLITNAADRSCFILRNYAGEKATALVISANAICLGTNAWNGGTTGRYPFYDCGRPHRVLVITTNRVAPGKFLHGKPKSTNRPIIIPTQES